MHDGIVQILVYSFDLQSYFIFVCVLTVCSHSDEGDQQDGAQRSQADGGEAIRPDAAQPGAQTVGGSWASWRWHREERVGDSDDKILQ